MLLIINQRILNQLIIDISINCPSPNNYAYWKCAVTQYILHVDYMQYRRQPMNEIKYSIE